MPRRRRDKAPPGKVPRDAATDRIARAILESQEIFNQTFGMPGAIYIECHDEEIMRGREEARESSPPSLPATLPPSRRWWLSAGGWLGARSWRHPLIRDIPIMDAGLKGRQVRGFDSRIRSADTFDLRACSRFWILFHVSRPGYKARDGLHFCLFWNFTKESFTPRKRPHRLRAHFLSLSLSPILFLASLLRRFLCSHLISLDSLRNDVLEWIKDSGT